MPDDIVEDGTVAEVVKDEGGNTLTILVTPRGNGLPLDTLLRILGDALRILTELDLVVSGTRRPTLEWVVTSLSFNSPLTLRLIGRKKPNSPFPGRVVDSYVTKILQLENGIEPLDFSEKAMERAQDIVRSVVRDGVLSVQFSTPGLPPVTPTARLAENVEQILKRRYYYEVTTLDGRLDVIDVHGPPKFTIFDPLTRLPINCNIGEDLLDQALDSIRTRVSVQGKAKFNRAGRPISMDVDSIRSMKGPADLAKFPTDKTVDLTGGLSSEDYVRRSRDGR